MQLGFIKAELISIRKIIATYIFESEDETYRKSVNFTLCNKDKRYQLEFASVRSSHQIYTFELNSPIDLVLGEEWLVKTDEDEILPLNYDRYVTSDEFSKLYTYNGNDLGANYSKSQTSFNFWSPLSEKVFLKLEKHDNNFLLLPMKRKENGVYRAVVNGDLFNRKYCYVVIQGGKQKNVRDPYGIGMSLNSQYSAVIDLESVTKLGKVKPKRKINQPQDAIIYELHIRDFTELDENNPNAGKYLGILNKIKYLKRLGVTHVQLLPVHDYFGVDDLTNDKYNWGYNPINYFSLEGSYSSLPEDPLSRLIEFKTLVNELHKADIRVVMDVVYNHIYDYLTSDFHKNVPCYFFRRHGKKYSNGSGCGNDIATERSMVRKLILDSVTYFVDVFDVDGFRFDLLGLIDIKTSQDIIKAVKSRKPDALLYGEGWNLLTELPENQKSTTQNGYILKDMGFFNEYFRDVIKGNTFDKNDRGFILGNNSRRNEIEDVLFASLFGGKFKNANQSINYVECHDNQTLFDKISYFDEDLEIILKRVKLANALTILAFGVPFIHMGQEIGLSKEGLDNSYNIPKVNSMNWKLVKERDDMVSYMSDLIKLRNEAFQYHHLSKFDDIVNPRFELYHHSNGLFTITIKDKSLLKKFNELVVVINPTDEPQNLEFEDFYRVLLTSAGIDEKVDIQVQHLIVPDISLEILVK